MSQYGGYDNPYYGGYYYPNDKQTPYYGYGQPDYVTGHAEGSGSSFHNFEDFHPPHGHPRIYPEKQSPYEFSPSRSTPQSSYIQGHARSDGDHRNFLVPENEYQVIPQPLQRLIEKIDNPPKDGDCGYTCVAWRSEEGRGISTPELIRKHLSAELKKDKKMYEMIEGRNIDEDIRNTKAGKSAGVAGWLKIPLFGSSYSGYPPFCMAFVNSNHYVVLKFKKVNRSIPAPPIDGWWLRKSSSRNKNLWLQSLENYLKLFQKLMPSSSRRAIINLN
ncbi:hypothetical protein BY996DRAFT_8398029 [Phakopsora pachyrhizi]|nr:hypothetical protein BY996DRAFT_8398029 [Phakopsora pachyrhizi]